MRTDDLQDPARASVDPLVRYFRATRKRPSPGRIRRLIEATLLFDSSQPLEFSEARSIQGGGKQLLYQADVYDIDIRSYPADPPDYTDLIGQVLAPGDDFDPVNAVPVYLCSGNESRLFTLTDPIGVFHLRKVPEGVYDLKLVLPNYEIAVRAISISRPL